jgi:hypothetical protein
MMTTTNLTEDLNLLINKALGAGLTVAQIDVVIENAQTALDAVSPVPSHDRTIEDTGAALNPSQP